MPTELPTGSSGNPAHAPPIVHARLDYAPRTHSDDGPVIVVQPDSVHDLIIAISDGVEVRINSFLAGDRPALAVRVVRGSITTRKDETLPEIIEAQRATRAKKAIGRHFRDKYNRDHGSIAHNGKEACGAGT